MRWAHVLTAVVVVDLVVNAVVVDYDDDIMLIIMYTSFTVKELR